MDLDKARDFVKKNRNAVMATYRQDGRPQLSPVAVGLDGEGRVVISTRETAYKTQNLRRDPRVSLLVEDGIGYTELRGVVFYGTAELIEDVDTVAGILAAVTVHKGGAATEATEAQMRRTAEKRTGIRVRPEKVVSWDHRKLAGAY